MAFRADESANNNLERALRFLTRSLPDESRKAAKDQFIELIDTLGPVVDSYPSWHPLVFKHEDPSCPQMTPSPGCGYRGLDHTVFFRNGFLACPYSKGDDIIASVEELPETSLYNFQAKRLKTKLYHENATPILVTCRWADPMLLDGTIPQRWATGLLLEQELQNWKTAHHAETWETMRNHFLGTPCGSRSSLFVNEKTGQSLKRLWNTIVQTGVFGPVNVAGYS